MTRNLLTALFAGLVSACVPMMVAQYPALKFEVVDEAGTPIDGAEVYFVRYSVHPFPGVAPFWTTSLVTNSDGRASIEKNSEWQAVFLAPDGGAQEYDWAWCVKKCEYSPVSVVGIRNSLESENIGVVLKGKNEVGGCVWQPKYRGGEFVANAP